MQSQDKQGNILQSSQVDLSNIEDLASDEATQADVRRLIEIPYSLG